jgi:hypothetical protein
VTRDALLPVLYVVACAAPPVLHIRDLIGDAQARGWDVCLILTPTAAIWLADDLADLATQTGHPVRTSYKRPGEPDVLPPADAIVAAPVTSNTFNKWAAGISDTLALGLITEAIGKRLPIVALPSLNRQQADHPAFSANVARLREAGVTVLLDDEGYALEASGHEPRSAQPWTQALNVVERLGQSRPRAG